MTFNLALFKPYNRIKHNWDTYTIGQDGWQFWLSKINYFCTNINFGNK